MSKPLVKKKRKRVGYGISKHPSGVILKRSATQRIRSGPIQEYGI